MPDDDTAEAWLATISAGEGADDPLALATVVIRLLTQDGREYDGELLSCLAGIAGLATAEGGDAGEVRQSAARWVGELFPLVVRSLNRYEAAYVLCLLDPPTAASAQYSGLLELLRAKADDIGGCLSQSGLWLLRRRAPLAALAAGALPPVKTSVSAPGAGPATQLAIADQGAVPPGEIGLWAATFTTGTFLESGGSGERVELPSRPVALHWTRETSVSERFCLNIVLGKKGEPGLRRVVVVNASPLRTQSEPPNDPAWLPARSVAFDHNSAVMVPLDGGLRWGYLDGALVDLNAPGTPGAVARWEPMVAAVVGRQVLVQDLAGASTWQPVVPAPPGPALVAATRANLYVADGESLIRVGWAAPPDGHAAVVFSEGAEVNRLIGGADLVIAGTRRAAALVREGAVIARFEVDEDITAIAVSNDQTCLGLATADGRTRFWRIDVPGELQLTAYDADTDQGRDLLGIQPTVDALATLICARVMTPPLSVGLFGAWGSGKSFFMRSLEERVDEITRESSRSGRAQSDLWAWRNTRQVRFNAWHYASADVWAGLLEQLLRELTAPRKGRLELPAELGALQRLRLERLNGAQEAEAAAGRAVEGARKHEQEARQKVNDAEEGLRKAESERESALAAEQARSLFAASRSAAQEALAGLGLRPTARSVEELARELAAAKSRAASLGAYVRGPVGRTRLIVALLSAFVAAFGAVALTWVIAPGLASLTTFITTGAGIASALTVWLRGANDWTGRIVASLSAAEQTVAEAVDEQAAALAGAQAGARGAPAGLGRRAGTRCRRRGRAAGAGGGGSGHAGHPAAGVPGRPGRE